MISPSYVLRFYLFLYLAISVPRKAIDKRSTRFRGRESRAKLVLHCNKFTENLLLSLLIQATMSTARELHYVNGTEIVFTKRLYHQCKVFYFYFLSVYKVYKLY